MSMLFLLPVECVGTSIMPMLCLRDLVLLDSAVLSHLPRRTLHEAFSHALPVNLARSGVDSRACRTSSAWDWCSKRNLLFTGVEISVLSLEKLERYTPVEGESLEILFRNDVSAIAEAKGLNNKITSIILNDVVDIDRAVSSFSRMGNVRRFTEKIIFTRKADVIQFMSALPKLEELVLSINLSGAVVDAIGALGSSLRSLSICANRLSESRCERLSHTCTNLTKLTLTARMDQIPCFGPLGGKLTDRGLWLLAEGCRRLQEVSFEDYHSMLQPGDYLLPFATHCSLLRNFKGDRFTLLSDAALTALAGNCAHMGRLNAIWAVTAVDTVHAAASLLGRLRSVTLGSGQIPGVTARTTDSASPHVIRADSTLATALEYLSAVESLTLTGFVFATSKPLRSLSARCTRLSRLVLERSRLPRGNHAPASVAAVVRCNGYLTVLQLTGNDWLTDSVIEAIAESCALLRELKCKDHLGSTESLMHCEAPSAVNDAAFVKLAAGCNRLRILWGCSGPGVTDASLAALAQHCRDLLSLDLCHSTAVTETALVHLVQKCGNLRQLLLSRAAFDQATAVRVRHASRRLVGPDHGTVRCHVARPRTGAQEREWEDEPLPPHAEHTGPGGEEDLLGGGDGPWASEPDGIDDAETEGADEHSTLMSWDELGESDGREPQETGGLVGQLCPWFIDDPEPDSSDDDVEDLAKAWRARLERLTSVQETVEGLPL